MAKARSPKRRAQSSSIRQRFDLLQAGLDHIDQGITVFDPDLRLVGWNRRFFTLLEFPDDMARAGVPFEAFMRYNAERGEYGSGDVEAKVAERVAAARRFAPHYMERMRANGQLIAVRGTPLPDKGFVTVYTDITQQRRNERLIQEQNAELDRRVKKRTAELQRSEERLRLVTDAVPALIAYIDAGLVYRFANKGYADWYGRTKEDIVGSAVLGVIGPELFAVIRPHLELAATGREATYEYQRTRPDGRTVFARSTVVPELDALGKVAGYYVLSFDVTEQKKAQAALLQAQKMEAIGQLTGGLAHDFNNLLAIMLGNLASLRDKFRDQADIAELLEPALQSARRGVDLIRRLLAFARRQPLEARPIEAHALLADIVPLLRHSIPESIQILVSAPAEPIYALIDPSGLESALLNLALNARDAMSNGGELEFEVTPCMVEADMASEFEVASGEYVRIAVRDNGAGMDAGTLARAFEPFFTRKEFGTGSGLGLSMVYGFLRQSGGGIRIHSRLGAGTEVVMLLPRHFGEETAEEHPAPRPNELRLHSGLVLLVEDEPEVRKVIRRQLTELGYAVLEADSGAEAAQMVDNVDDISILVSDVVMPGGISGQVLAQAARERRPDLRIVLISGYAEAVPEATGSPHVLRKPFTREELATAIAEAGR